MSNTHDLVATYRIQFNKEFTFSDLKKIIPYLVKLGIGTVYASPIFQATSGSMHGYDGTDPNRINPEIGTEGELREINKLLNHHHISWLQDIVPNHLSFHEENKWLMDVLEKGSSSPFAAFFDIDWNHPKYQGKLMVPFPGSRLEEILKKEIPSAGHYVFCPWQETDSTINYRRFFTVNSLICTNIQDERVFVEFHRLIKRLVDNKVFSGLRVDHIDGLYDPKEYLERLRDLAGENTYIAIEKILEPGENLPNDWPIEGSSGYDFLGMVNNLFTNKKSEQPLTRFYNELTGNLTPVSQQMREKKSHILYRHMGGELDNLCRLYKDLGLGKNMTDEQVRNSIAAYLINCPVYRYYGDDIPMMEHDKDLDSEPGKKFYRRAMQFTGPLMAKGVEDTLMYTYYRFIGHNEVGDSPETFGCTHGEFHDLMEYRASHLPMSMNATSTHDTKRGEDARARLNVLTDLHEEWIYLVKKWKKENGALRDNGRPDDNDEYFIYQTLIATYPTNDDEEKLYPSRIASYLQKALREGKLNSTWASPDTRYENACIAFAQKLIDKGGEFWKTFHPFVGKIIDYGMINSFGQLALKFTCPGIPDIYQGSEFWDLSMVDPDNRRPVDYSLREKMLDTNASLQDLWSIRNNAQVKLLLLKRLFGIRREHASFFTAAKYVRVQVTGEYAGNVFAFIRELQNTSILTVLPLHLAEIMQGAPYPSNNIGWKDTRVILPAGAGKIWHDLLHGERVNGGKEILVEEIFQKFPLAILKN